MNFWRFELAGYSAVECVEKCIIVILYFTKLANISGPRGYYGDPLTDKRITAVRSSSAFAPVLRTGPAGIGRQVRMLGPFLMRFVGGRR